MGKYVFSRDENHLRRLKAFYAVIYAIIELAVERDHPPERVVEEVCKAFIAYSHPSLPVDQTCVRELIRRFSKRGKVDRAEAVIQAPFDGRFH